uniref:Sulfatase N-terminal domain-containing protein n=2 Tax=Clastoptera arizonana TaxID=38151 RepID=A0A1B6DDM5_9HEMI
MKLLYLLVLVQVLAVQEAVRSRPNIIFILADDLGWNDVGFHGSNQIPTPNIDSLAFSGTILNNYYSQPLCSPSRSALMTGNHPIHTGMQRYVINAPEPWGLPLEEKLLPEYLRDLGYINRAVGKWHLGFFKKEYTPLYRGFHSHFGYWLGHKDYYSHLAGEGGYQGYDFRRNMESTWTVFGDYTTDLFTEEAEEIILSHDTDFPLFLYIAHLATHAPLQAPYKVVKSFTHIEDKKRRIFAGMVTKMDESVGRVVAALDRKGILNNSIIVFTSDNGGATHGYDGNVASNWPLRGGKDTLWEGGVRVPAVIWSPLLAKAPAIHEGLMSVMDWLPTLITAVNGTFINKCCVDGYNQWEAINQEKRPPYHHLLHNIDSRRYAMRNGHWKIISGTSYNERFDGWYGKLSSDQQYDMYAIVNSQVTDAVKHTTRPLPDKNHIIGTRNYALTRCAGTDKTSPPCRLKISPCLFNITADPCEQNNLADQHPQILKKLLKLLHLYHPVEPRNKGPDAASRPVYWNYTWTHWKDYPPPRLLDSNYEYIDYTLN